MLLTSCAAATAPIFPRYRGCRRFPVLSAERGLSGWQDLFFHAWPSTTRKSHAVGRATDEILFEFITTDANGFRVQPRNFGNLLDAAMPAPPGFAAGNPASLLFVQTAENQMEIAMILLLWMITSLTCCTRTVPNRKFPCHRRPPSLVGPTDYHIPSNRGIELGPVLTVNGKAEVVVQDAAAYRRLVERAARIEREETVAAIREALADVEAGRTKPARQALKALAKKHGIPVDA